MLIGFIIIKLFKYLSPRTNRFRRLRVGGPLVVRTGGRLLIVGESKVSGESKMSRSPYNLLLKDGQPATNCYQLYYIIEDILFYFILIKSAFFAIKSKLAIDCKYSFSSLLALLSPPSSLESPTSIVTNILPL